MLMQINESDDTRMTFDAGPAIEKWLSVTQRKVVSAVDNVPNMQGACNSHDQL